VAEIPTPGLIELPQAKPVVEGLDRCRLYIAGYKGLQCLDADGEKVATLLEAELADGLFIDDATIVTWSSLRESVYFVDARSGELLDTLSLVPPQSAACERERVWATMGISAWLPRVGPPDRLCLEIMNGAYEDIADVRVAIDIDLVARSVAFTNVWGYETCAPDLPDGNQCRSPAPFEVTADEQHPYYVDEGALHRHRANAANAKAERVWGPFPKPPPREVTMSELDPIDSGFDTFEPVATTASGRYLILLGNLAKGDVAHLQALLLDRSTGDLFPIPQRPSDWPAPLELDAIATIGEGWLEALWVFFDERPRILPERDRFALGQLLLEPGVGAKRLPGRLIVPQ
jgi:hypothetical protein